MGKRIFYVTLIFLVSSWLISIRAQGNIPRRVISMAPNITEMVYRLGVDTFLVGRTEYCTYPPKALQLPSVGGYLDPDFETLVSLKPDAVLILPNAYYKPQLRQLGIQVYELPNETIEEILLSIRKLGEIFGKQAIARKVITEIKDTLNLVQNSAPSHPPRALILIGHEPTSLRGLYAVSNGSFLGELWKMAGGENIFPQKKPRYFPISIETVVDSNPDIIIDIHGGALKPEARTACKALWKDFPTITAVNTHQVIIVDVPGVLIPGPRITRTAILFQRIIQSWHAKQLEPWGKDEQTH